MLIHTFVIQVDVLSFERLVHGLAEGDLLVRLHWVSVVVDSARVYYSLALGRKTR